MTKSIIFTGGGSAGHVTPNLALIKKFQSAGWKISYLGSPNGIERHLIAKTSVPYFKVLSGKLRRYFSWKNFLDPLQTVCGIFQACYWCYKIKPDVVFSKGGFVAFPVVVGAWLNRIPIIIHEADLTVGLANKLCFPFAQKICLTFPETKINPKYATKTLVSGLPIREEFFSGNAKVGREICQFNDAKKIILVIGGSLGSSAINAMVQTALPHLLPKFQIAHICGTGKIAPHYQQSGYQQFEYLNRELPHIMAAANLVISRAGANSIYELIALRKPSLLLPVSTIYSRGDQVANAKYVTQKNLAAAIVAEELTLEKFLEKIAWVELHTTELLENMGKYSILNSSKIIFELACSLIKQNSTAGR